MAVGGDANANYWPTDEVVVGMLSTEMLEPAEAYGWCPSQRSSEMSV